MLFVGVMQVYINKGVYLCNAILIRENFCYQYLTIISQLKSNIFQRKLAVVLAIYLELSVLNFIYVRLDLTFLLYNV